MQTRILAKNFNIIKHMKKAFSILLATALCAGTLSSCEDDDPIQENGIIYLTQAIESRSAYDVIIADTAQTLSVSASYGGQGYPASDVQVQFAIDTSLVSSYNASHGSSYEVLPADAYTAAPLNTVIKAGTTISDPVVITVNTQNLPKGAQYLLPVKMVSTSSGDINPQLQTAYLRLNITRLEIDVTGTGTLSVSKDNNDGADAGEGSKKLVDNNINSKFLVADFPQGLWMQMDLAEAKVVRMYRLTSGNDAPERDPKSWRLLGSNDGSTWTELDKQTEQYFSGRNQTVNYEFENDTAYKYYRWVVDEDNGSNLFQISEWRLVTF